MKPVLIRLSPFIIFILLAVFLWRGLSLDPRHLPTAHLNKALPAFSLPHLDRPTLHLTNQDLKGQVALINVFASWCSACAEEHVMLLSLARQGIVIYGLNYKDDLQDARQYLERYGNPYRQVACDFDGRVAIDLGVYGAPETFVIDKSLRVRYRHVGKITEADWQETIAPLMNALEKE